MSVSAVVAHPTLPADAAQSATDLSVSAIAGPEGSNPVVIAPHHQKGQGNPTTVTDARFVVP